ncbi:hypothetical protein EJ04DRAFT_363368 [Polyplosphaeria fusca]|uniref:Uncharacterized protein n=1 Tax=Polyplosphaeria fusca TaxID=682080 RepID=A0A9P4QUS8_9PLEO|nr:hypothetical protein EJ04DRAFT_363368 [Polyplosphaeria fusca]
MPVSLTLNVEMPFSEKEPVEYLRFRVLGIHSNQVVGAVECALVEFEQDLSGAVLRMRLVRSALIPIPLAPRIPLVLESQTRRFGFGKDDTPAIALGPRKQPVNVHVAAIALFCHRLNLAPRSINAIGLKSQSIEHVESKKQGELSPVELGDGVAIAQQTGITTITEFKTTWSSKNMSCSLDGHLNELTLRHIDRYRVCVCIDNTLRFYAIPPYTDIDPNAVVEWQCKSSGVKFMEELQEIYYGRGGRLGHVRSAAVGKVYEGLVHGLLEKKRFTHLLHRAAPGDEKIQEFADECMLLALTEHDIIATVARITASDVVRQYRTFQVRHLPPNQRVDEILVCGLGSRNDQTMSYLRSQIQETRVNTIDTAGIPSIMKNAVASAECAMLSILGLKCSSRGSKQERSTSVTGKISPGSAWRSMMNHISKFRQDKAVPAIASIIVDSSNLETS